MFTSVGDKMGRYVHNYAHICMFCRQRLLEPHFDGQPLKISDWCHALYGDYTLDDASVPPANSTGPGMDEKSCLRHEHKQAIHSLFAKSARLISYSLDMLPKFRRDRITAAVAASDRNLAREVIWEVDKMNWWCELRALDALLFDVGHNEWLRWEHEQAVCEVWTDSNRKHLFSTILLW